MRKGFDDDGLPDHLMRWLDVTMRRLRDDVFEAYGRPEYPRPSQRRLLALITDEGARITDLSERAGMTKQAAGEAIDALEADGFVRSVRDPSDRRVRRVVRTTTGDRASDESNDAIWAVEAKLRAEIGPRRYDLMKQVLREIGDHRRAVAPPRQP